jgi:hypothetical protein
MNKEVAEKWIEALRSEKYSQTAGFLHNPHENSFCCLGVLCDLYHKETGKGEWGDQGWKFIGENYDYSDTSSTSLPPSVMRWAGIKYRNGSIESTNSSLMFMNDSGIPFKKIAEKIEMYQEEL